ncbi:hypothetical protein MMC18_008372 [Xylographa bjoerkii]|nr:hypothetical protein [Xylographa bjoerkii]
MDADAASVGALLQKLESAKVTYFTSLNEAHDAAVASLKTTQNDEGVEDESSEDPPGRLHVEDSRVDILQTERDPLACETYYADQDLKEFLGDLDAQLQYERLGPASTGRGFVCVYNGRIMDAVPLKESILELLQPLQSLPLDADDRKLHLTRVNNRGYASKDRILSYNAVCFTFLDGDHAGSWNLYHDAVSDEDPQNIWEMIRASILSSSWRTSY